MYIYAYDSDRNLIGIVESFEYFRWTRRYSEAGAFTLKAIGSPENAALLQIGNWIWKNDDEEIAIIEHIELTQTDKEMITVSGRFATALLARRIIWGTETYTGNISGCIADLINNHLINPADPARAVTGVTFSTQTLAIPVRTQFSYKNLYETVTSLLVTADVGIKTTFDPTTGDLIITLYQGTTSQAVFSREYENLVSQQFIHSTTTYADTVLVAGEGEGGERTLATIVGASGLNRREVFVDARDLRSENFPDAYEDALLYRATAKLADHAMVQSLDAEVNTHSNLVYKTDYDIGSIVTIQARRWGVSLQARITEVTESYDASGLSLDVTFGRGTLTLSQRLKEAN
jgi:hypothetical protein